MIEANWLARLNQKMPVYKGCTLEEILTLGVVSMLITIVVTMMVLEMLFGLAIAGIVVGLVLSFFVTRIVAGAMAHYKIGKPDGFLLQAVQVRAGKLGILSPRFIVREGKWSIDRINT